MTIIQYRSEDQTYESAVEVARLRVDSSAVQDGRVSFAFHPDSALRRRDVLEFQNRPDQSLLEFCPLAGSLDPVVCCAHVSSLFGFDVKQSSGRIVENLPSGSPNLTLLLESRGKIYYFVDMLSIEPPCLTVVTARDCKSIKSINKQR